MPHYHALYLSPHLDDAVLSCGGQIAQQTATGLPVLIVTLMAGDPPARPLSAFAQKLHDRWQLDAATAVAARRAEDTAACDLLQADTQHLDIPDCIYRADPATGTAFYNGDGDIFGPIHPADKQLAAELATRFAQLPTAETIYIPLTVGHHVDHQLTRLAAELWPTRTPIFYYEDYPYARREGAVTAALGDPDPWQARVIPLTAEALTRKCAAIAAYQSQVSTFFRDTADLEAQVGDYAAQVGGERLWQRR
jgi:LmbE family N-acetylglucosaminyl deacetylase